MGPKEFFPLLDFAFMPKNALSPRCVPSSHQAFHKDAGELKLVEFSLEVGPREETKYTIIKVSPLERPASVDVALMC